MGTVEIVEIYHVALIILAAKHYMAGTSVTLQKHDMLHVPGQNIERETRQKMQLERVAQMAEALSVWSQVQTLAGAFPLVSLSRHHIPSITLYNYVPKLYTTTHISVYQTKPDKKVLL